MRIGQVFQQEMPCSRVGVPIGLKAPQQLLTRFGGGDLIVKGNFLPAGVPIGVTQTVGSAGLEHDRTRCAHGVTIVDRTKTRDFRQDRCVRAFDNDIANANVDRRFAKGRSEMLWAEVFLSWK
jgi:hypothetical protein